MGNTGSNVRKQEQMRPGPPPLRRKDSDSSASCNNVVEDGQGCFSCAFPSFCSPRDYKHASSSVGGRHKGSIEDRLGTPVQQTPPSIRRARMERLGLLSSKYEGLEKEAPKASSSALNSNQKRDDVARNGSSGWTFGGVRHSKQQTGKNSPKIFANGGSQLHENPNAESEFQKKYELKEVLGVGSTSTCYKCLERATGGEWACKIIDKHDMETKFKDMVQQLEIEVKVLRNLQHPNIVSLNDVYITDKKIFLVMELMSGGELFDYIVEKGTLTEEEASQIIRRVTSALVYMHQKNIIHRDLKPENLMLTHNGKIAGKTPEVKLIDFGLSKLMLDQPMASSFLGTRGYLAPEMLQRQQYTRAVDAWALGVITYVLLCGCLPFDDDSAVIPTDAMLQSKFVLRFPRWAKNLSASAKDLLSRLLDTDPRTRYTAEQALQHPWVVGQTAPKTLLQSPSMIHRKSPGGMNDSSRTPQSAVQRACV